MKPCRARRAKCLSIIFLGYKVKYVLISSWTAPLSRPPRPRQAGRQTEAVPITEAGAEAEAEAVILIMIILTLISVANLCTIWLIDWRCLHCKWQRSTQTAQNIHTHKHTHTHTRSCEVRAQTNREGGQRYEANDLHTLIANGISMDQSNWWH